MESLDKRVGKRLKKIRKIRNLTQEQLCNLTNLSQASISMLETGRMGYTSTTLTALAEVLDIHPSDLFLDEDYPALVITRRSVRKLLKSVSDMADDDIGRLIERAELLKEKGNREG